VKNFDSEASEIEQPVHNVTVSTFYMGETEVTQALWKAVMGSNPSIRQGDDLPVEMVDWYDFREFIHKLIGLTGRNFRLPTEAEWEYAARGGNKSKGYKYAGSNTIENVAWYWNNSDHKTHPVKGKSPNELGLYDMSGNVFEWCIDWYGNYENGSQTDPQGPFSGSDHVLRGGSWFSGARHCRVSDRFNGDPHFGNDCHGFRLVLSQ
jgi:formylglycine-generating enzyme required for sulfatase activity